MPHRRRRLAALATLLIACGGDEPSPDAPVAVTSQNLDGYWHSATPDSSTSMPLVFHFGPAFGTDVDVSGSVPLAEVVGTNFLPSIGPFSLGEGGTVEFQRASNGSVGTYLDGTIDGLTGEEMTLTVRTDSSVLQLRRAIGCAAPDTWIGAGSPITDAAWGPDGSLHMLLDPNGSDIDRTGYYAWIPPGRCTPYVPDFSATGESIDVGESGTIRIMNVSDTTVTLVEIPAEPWLRQELDETLHPLFTDQGTTYARPAARVLERDGRATAIWANGGDYHTWSETEEGTFEYELARRFGGGTITPQTIHTRRDQQGNHYLIPEWIRDGGFARATLFDGETWSAWDVPQHPDLGAPRTWAFGPDGTFYAAWSAPRRLGAEDTVVVGQLDDGGVWMTMNAGPGLPFDMHVGDSLMEIATIDGPMRAPLYWTRVPLPLEPGNWSSSFAHDNLAGLQFLTQNIELNSEFPFARFGPNGQIALGGYDLTWRDPAREGTDRFLWAAHQFTFETDAPLSVSVDEFGASCDSDCEFPAVPGTVTPVRIEASTETERPVISGQTRGPNLGHAGDELMLFTPRFRFDQGNVAPSIVRADVSTLDARALPIDSDSARLLRDYHFSGGRHYVATASTLIVFTSDGAELARRELRSIEQVQGNPDGTCVVIGSEDGIGSAYLKLDDDLQTITSLALAGPATLDGDGAWEVAMTDGGEWGIHRVDTVRSLVALIGTGSASVLIGDATGLYVLYQEHNGVPQVVRSYGPDGALRWEIPFPTAQRPVSLNQGNLVAYVDPNAALYIDETAVPVQSDDVPRRGAVEIDANSGQVVRQVLGDGVWPSVPPGGFAATQDGVFVLSSQTTLLNWIFAPWEDEQVRTDFSAEVPPGFCSAPGAGCGNLPGIIASDGGDHIYGVWAFDQAFALDGEGIAMPQGRALALGRWSPPY